MNFFRTLSAITGIVLIVGAAGTDERFVEAGQTPPEGIEQMVLIGLALLLFSLICKKRKAKK